MKSIKNVFKIGSGPSSSHTMGPEAACKKILELHSNIKSVDVELMGSLALTGRGHLTDSIILSTLSDVECNIIWNYTEANLEHENTMKIYVTLDNDSLLTYTIFSIGGGDIVIKELEGDNSKDKEVYPHKNITEISKFCYENNLNFASYVFHYEPEIKEYLKEVWEVMENSIKEGLEATSVLPGELKVRRRAKILGNSSDSEMLLSSYAYAVNEQNASGGTIVTAPTCGACGVIPASLLYYKHDRGFSEDRIIEALAVAGLFGAVIKKNATVSGAEAGCQAEVGSATAMAAAAISHIHNGNLRQVESAAEIAMEHQLGLTCDPVLGYVQIPCIQRNAVGAVKARMAAKLGFHVSDFENVEFDTIVDVMYETGKDMASSYRETSTGGLAKHYKMKIEGEE